MEKKPLRRYILASTFLLFFLVLRTLTGNVLAEFWGEEDLPPASSFDASAGLQLEGAEDTFFVGAADFNVDNLPDLIGANDEGLTIYTNVLENEERLRGPFRAEGTSVELDSNYALIQGHYLEDKNDPDVDLLVLTSPEIEYVKEEKTGTITNIPYIYRIVDSNATWRYNELTGLKLRPNAELEKEFEIVGNGPRESGAPDTTPYIDVYASQEPENRVDHYAEVGDIYSYQVWAQKESEPMKLKVFLNEKEKGVFLEPECEVPLGLPEGRVISRVAAGDYNRDEILDLALLYTEGYVGRIAEYEWTEGVHGTVYSLPKEDKSLVAKLFRTPLVQARQGTHGNNSGRFETPFRADIIITDYEARFDQMELNGGFLIPDINRNYAFPIVSWSANASSVSAEVELYGVSSAEEGENFMNSLTLNGNSYAIKTGDLEAKMLKGLGGGCFQSVDAYSGEVYEVDYLPKEDEPGVSWTVFTDPTQNFLPEDSLLGRKVYFSKDETDSGRFEIAHNSKTAIYLLPEEGDRTRSIDDTKNDNDPSLYIIEPLEETFEFSWDEVIPDRLSTAILPSSYLSRVKNLSTVVPPVRAAFADFDQDERIDFVYANGNLFFKQNQE